MTPVLTRQRITKAGTFTGWSGSEKQVTGWISDPTYPAAISANKLQVTGSGMATVSATVGYDTTLSVDGVVKLYHNGTVIGTATMTDDGTYTIGPVSVSVAAGDLIHLTFTKGGVFGSVTAANTEIVIIPVPAATTNPDGTVTGGFTELDLTEMTGMEAFVLADQLAEQQESAPELDVRIHDKDGFALGQVGDYMSTTATFKRNKVGPGTIELKGDDPWGPVGMTCHKTVVPVTIRTDNYKWTGRVDTCSKDTVDGIMSFTMQLVDDKSWFDHILVFPTWFSPVQFQPIRESVHIGPAVTCIKNMISEQGLRLNAGLWNIVNNVTNPAAVFADLMMKFEFVEDFLDGNGAQVDVPFVVVPTNPFTDTSKWTAMTARMDSIATVVEQTLKDCGLELKAWLWEPGDEQPAPDSFILTRPTIVFDVVDKTNVQHITGTALDGLIGTAVELSDTLFGEIVFAMTGQNVADQYLTDATNPYGGILSHWLGLDSKPPWVIYEDGPYSGIKESHITAHHPLAWQVVGGGKSPEWVNKGIDLILEALLGAIIAAAAAASGGAAAAISAIPSSLLDGVFDNMILAFQLITNFARKRSLGKFGWPEFFTQTGGTAWTLNELVALESAMWDSRGYFSFQMVTRDGSPYTFGDGPGADFFINDPVSWIDDGVIYTDYCDEAVVTDNRETYDLTITIGDGSAQEAPVAKLMRYMSSADSAIKAITLAA